MTVHTCQFEVVKHTISGLADDRLIQVLLIAFSFGAFIEGAAGFGAPVAITAAMLIGLGFRPLPAAGLSLIGNTAPVAFGSLGIPIITLAQVTLNVVTSAAIVKVVVPPSPQVIVNVCVSPVSGSVKMPANVTVSFSKIGDVTVTFPKSGVSFTGLMMRLTVATFELNAPSLAL